MGGRGLAAAGRTCGGIEHGPAAAPAPCGRGGRLWRGHARALVRPFAGAGRTAASKKRRAAEKTGREREGKGAPLCRPTPEALSQGRGRGSAAAGPAGVGGGGAESVGISADTAAAPIAASKRLQRERSARGRRARCRASALPCNHSIPAWEFYVTSTEHTLRQSYRWSIGVFSSPSADPEGRCSANKKIHERGIVGREEFVPVSLVVLQFRPDGSPLCVQP